MRERALRVAIVGSRDFPQLWRVRLYVLGLPPGSIVISGGARGVDSVADLTARRRGLGRKTFWPNYEAFGNQSYAIRNREIAEYCDRLVAFSFNESRGTAMTIGFAREYEKPVLVVSVT